MQDEHKFVNEPVRVPTSAFGGRLGLAKRAGKVTAGAALVCPAVRSRKKPALVIIDAAASDNTKRKFWGLCHAHGVPYLTLSSERNLGDMLGAGSQIVIAAVTDAALAARVAEATEPAPAEAPTSL